jgi:hypothetical protein
LKAIDVIDVLSDLFILRGAPGHIRSDNGPEFVAKGVQDLDRSHRRDAIIRSAKQIAPRGFQPRPLPGPRTLVLVGVSE